tara:strand:+ start:159 stop:767 length:609 start_codon:yes stop_codon:yes gene_type:complete
MNKGKFAVIIAYALSAFGTPSAMAGEVLTVVKAERQPLMQSERGRITSCGIHFSVAARSTSAAFGIQGSINMTFFEKQYPALIFKMTVVEPKNGSLTRMDLVHAYVAMGEFSTATWKTLDSDDGLSWLAYNTLDESRLEAEFAEFIRVSEIPIHRAWLGFNSGVGSDFTLQLPELSTNEMNIPREFDECRSAAVHQMSSGLE